MSEEHQSISSLIETYRRKLDDERKQIAQLLNTVEQLQKTVIELQGEPKPLVDKIFDVILEGKTAASAVNAISKRGKAVIKLYGSQIVEVL